MKPCNVCWKKQYCNDEMESNCSQKYLYELEIRDFIGDEKFNFINDLPSLFLTKSAPLYLSRTAEKVT